MSGMMPKFLENRSLPEGYFDTPNPYKNAPSCKVDLYRLSGYAESCGKSISELSFEEICKFAI